MTLTLQPARPQLALANAFAESRECWKTGDYPRFIEVLQRARHFDPNNSRLLVELGAAQTMVYDFVAAERYFEEAIAVASSKSEALMAVAHHWRRIRNYQAAAQCFHRVLELQPVPIAAILRLAEFYDRGRDLEKCSEMVERALSLDSSSGAALLIKAKLRMQQRQLEDAERLLRDILGKASCAEVHSATWDQLGNVLDRQGRYDEAMAAFVSGKLLMRQESARAATQLQALHASRKQTVQSLTAKQFQQWRQFGQAEFRPARLALLSGHPRSGTTLLEYVLDAHPEVLSADETFVFHNRSYLPLGRSRAALPPLLPTLAELAPRTLRQFRADYLRGLEGFFGKPIGNQLLLDKNPVLTPDIPAFYRVFPEAKFLVALRDPRDVCLSCFMQSASISPDSSSWLSLENTIQNYTTIMDVWLAAKPHLPNAIEVRYEDMVEDVAGNARRVLEFLGCAWDERVLRHDEHARGKVIRSPTYVEVTKPVYKTAVGRWVNYQKYFEPHLEKLAPFLRAFGYE